MRKAARARKADWSAYSSYDPVLIRGHGLVERTDWSLITRCEGARGARQGDGRDHVDVRVHRVVQDQGDVQVQEPEGHHLRGAEDDRAQAAERARGGQRKGVDHHEPAREDGGDGSQCTH